MAIKNLDHAKAVQGRRKAAGLKGLAASVRRWCRAQKKNYGEIAPDYKTKWGATNEQG